MKDYIKRAQDNYRENQQRKGIVRVQVQVPEENREAIKEIAQAMREKNNET